MRNSGAEWLRVRARVRGSAAVAGGGAWPLGGGRWYGNHLLVIFMIFAGCEILSLGDLIVIIIDHSWPHLFVLFMNCGRSFGDNRSNIFNHHSPSA